MTESITLKPELYRIGYPYNSNVTGFIGNPVKSMSAAENALRREQIKHPTWELHIFGYGGQWEKIK